MRRKLFRTMRLAIPSFVFAVIIMLSGLGCAPVFAADDFFQVTMIDVGKGDCFLVQTGEKEDPDNVMIDTGYKETAPDVIKYLKDHGAYRIDAIIISHFHKDHVGGAAAILQDPDIMVSKVYMPDYDGHRDVYEAMMEVLNSPDCMASYKKVKEESSFKVNNASYRLYPSTIAFDGDNDNDMSLAALLEYEGQKALFAGDLEKEGIKELQKNYDLPKIDILKVPYHGGEEEQTAKLLKRLNKDGIAIITDGHERRANGTLVDFIKEEGYKSVSCTDDGTVVITYDATEQNYRVQKSKEQDVLIDGNWKYLLPDKGDNKAAIAGFTGSQTSLKIPSRVGGHPVSAIADSAFYNKKITDVTVPKGVAKIGASAFSWCSDLKNASLCESVEKIGTAAFSYCTKLESIRIPDSVTEIGESGFTECSSLKTAHLSKGMTEIPDSLFERCSGLESIEIPGNITAIGNEAFKKCTGLKDASLQEGVKQIGKEAFKKCENLKSITIPGTVTKLKKEALKGCSSLEEIHFSGTKAQWKSINEDNVACLPAEGVTIICSDGVIDKEEVAYEIAKDEAEAKETKIKSAKAKKGRKAQVTWEKTKDVSGYQIVFSTSSKFTSGTTKKATAGAKKTKKTIKKLTAGKKYYVKVRPYSSIKNPEKDANEKVYGKYSETKKFKVKK